MVGRVLIGVIAVIVGVAVLGFLLTVVHAIIGLAIVVAVVAMVVLALRALVRSATRPPKQG